MSIINVQQMLEQKYPAFLSKPDLITRPTVAFRKKLLRERELNVLFARCDQLEGLEFVDQVLEDFKFSYSIVGREKENIPVDGRVVIVANHPLGILDGLALIKMLSEVRRDVCIFANDILMQVKPLQILLLPVVNFGLGSNRGNTRQSMQRCTSNTRNRMSRVVQSFSISMSIRSFPIVWMVWCWRIWAN